MCLYVCMYVVLCIGYGARAEVWGFGLGCSAYAHLYMVTVCDYYDVKLSYSNSYCYYYVLYTNILYSIIQVK